MQKTLLGAAAAAALALSAAMQPAGLAASRCGSSSAAEAEQALRYITDLMVASNACKNTVYSEFALRNRDAIIRYQKAMILHLHGTQAFDRWDTILANQSAQREAALPPDRFCQQAAAMMQQASALDVRGFQAFAAAQVAVAAGTGAGAGAGQTATCRR